MNNIIKISVVVTLALVIALFAGCGKKKPAKENESSILTGGDIAEIFGEDNEVTSDIGKVELDPDADEDTVDISVLDELESGSSSDNSSKETDSSKNQSSSSSSKNESSSKNQSSSSKDSSSSQTSSTMGGMDKDNDSKVYTPGWI